MSCFIHDGKTQQKVTQSAQDMSYKHVQVSIVKDPGHPRPKRVCLLLSAKQFLSQGSTNYSPLKHCDRLTKPCLSQAWTSLQYNHTYKTAEHKSAFMLCQRWTRSHRIHIITNIQCFQIMLILGFKIQRHSNKWQKKNKKINEYIHIYLTCEA